MHQRSRHQMTLFISLNDFITSRVGTLFFFCVNQISHGMRHVFNEILLDFYHNLAIFMAQHILKLSHLTSSNKAIFCFALRFFCATWIKYEICVCYIYHTWISFPCATFEQLNQSQLDVTWNLLKMKKKSPFLVVINPKKVHWNPQIHFANWYLFAKSTE